MGTVDLYCERLGPGLLAEPLNAITNLAFFIAAWLLWRQSRIAGSLTGGVILLLALLVAFVKPRLRVRARHMRGEEVLRHATISKLLF